MRSIDNEKQEECKFRLTDDQVELIGDLSKSEKNVHNYPKNPLNSNNCARERNVLVACMSEVGSLCKCVCMCVRVFVSVCMWVSILEEK